MLRRACSSRSTLASPSDGAGRIDYVRRADVELIAATNGLGYLIMQAGDYLNVGLVFSGIIATAILGLTMDACLRGLVYVVDPSKRG